MSDPINVTNGIVTNLSATSALGANRVSKDYSILETSQEPTAVVSWTGLTSTPVTMGNSKERLWTYLVEIFVKDTGSGSAIMDKHATTIINAIKSLESDRTLQGTVNDVAQIRASRTPGEAVQVGTAALFPMNIEISVVEWPD